MKVILHNKLPLGGPAWLRAIAEEKEEMNHALPAENAEHKHLDDREVQGLRDAADRMERLEKFALSVTTEMVGFALKSEAERVLES